jgi:uncharacterized membrane protein
MTETVVGHYRSADDAERALHELEQAGFTKDDVSYVAPDATGVFQNRLRGRIEAGSGTAKGAGAGLLLGLAAMAIPGIGPAVAAGPLAMALIGAATGGLLGALADMGVSEQHAKHWADRVSEGGSLLVVRTKDGNAARAEEILRATAAEVRTHGAESDETSETHTDFPNYGSDGGSSQWGQRVLRVNDNDEVVVSERTITRDKGSKRFEE